MSLLILLSCLYLENTIGGGGGALYKKKKKDVTYIIHKGPYKENSPNRPLIFENSATFYWIIKGLKGSKDSYPDNSGRTYLLFRTLLLVNFQDNFSSTNFPGQKKNKKIIIIYLFVCEKSIDLFIIYVFLFLPPENWKIEKLQFSFLNFSFLF